MVSDDERERAPEAPGNAALDCVPLNRATPRAVADVLGLVTHDLRNPLAALSSNVGFLDLVKQQFDEDIQETLSDLRLSTEALGRIVDSLELMCCELKGALPAAGMSVGVETVLTSIAGYCNRSASSREVNLEFDLGDAPGVRVAAAELFLSRAVAALVQNALTAAPSRSTVRLRILALEDVVSFRVEDTGPTLDPKFIDLARSAVGQTTLKTHGRGRYSRGLGLYAVAKAAELSGARFLVASEAEGGYLEIVVPRA